jgi:hypothetical protein
VPLVGFCLKGLFTTCNRQVLLETIERITMAMWAYDMNLYNGPTPELLARVSSALRHR